MERNSELYMEPCLLKEEADYGLWEMGRVF